MTLFPALRRDGTTFAGQGDHVGSAFGAEVELEHLATADSFFDWIVASFDSAVRGRVLEVGAGIGTVSSRLAAHADRQVTGIEPADNLFPRLADASVRHGFTARQCTSAELLAEQPAPFDTLVYVNVLEHIEDDVTEVRRAAELCAPGGRLCVFVPAVPALYGTLDRKSGHYRRYRRDELVANITAGGFRVDDVRYFDVVGLLPYWLAYRVLRVQSLGGASTSLFAKVLVPMSKAAQVVLRRPPIGKNLILTATKAP
jgi:SAM-dependent methyltransferase